MFFGYFSNLGCGGSIVLSLIVSALLMLALFGLNSCFTAGAPLVVPGPGAPDTVEQAVDAGEPEPADAAR